MILKLSARLSFVGSKQGAQKRKGIFIIAAAKQHQPMSTSFIIVLSRKAIVKTSSEKLT